MKIDNHVGIFCCDNWQYLVTRTVRWGWWTVVTKVSSTFLYQFKRFTVFLMKWHCYQSTVPVKKSVCFGGIYKCKDCFAVGLYILHEILKLKTCCIRLLLQALRERDEHHRRRQWWRQGVHTAVAGHGGRRWWRLTQRMRWLPQELQLADCVAHHHVPVAVFFYNHLIWNRFCFKRIWNLQGVSSTLSLEWFWSHVWTGAGPFFWKWRDLRLLVMHIAIYLLQSFFWNDICYKVITLAIVLLLVHTISFLLQSF